MSTALSQGIYARLAGTESPALSGTALISQQGIAAQLATDPDTSAPAVYFGNMNDAKDASGNGLFPCITFRPSAGAMDGRFADDGLLVDEAVYDFEIWSQSRKATVITDIEELFQKLFDRRRQVTAEIPLSAGHLFWSEELVPLTLMYDDRINAWAGLMRYKFVEGRW